MAKYKNIDEYRGLDHGLSYVTGLSDLNPWTLRAMMRPHSFTGRTFARFYDDTIEMIKEFMHTKATLVPMPGPGRVVMVSALNNFLEPGEKLLMIDNGYWGRYPETLQQTYGYEIVPLVGPSHLPIDPNMVEDQLKGMKRDIKVAHMMHVETETGMVNPIRQVAEIVHRMLPDALFIVDSATAFPGSKLEVDKWGIDVDYFVSHKGFNGPSGLNFMSVNSRAMEVFEKRKTLPRGWYTSLQTWKDIWLDCKQDGRQCYESFPNVILYAMRAKLDLMNQMGEQKYLRKYELATKAVRMGLRKMSEPEDSLIIAGPKCKGCPGCDASDPNTNPHGGGRFCAQTDVGIVYPKGTNVGKFFEILEERYWITCPHFGFGDAREDGYFYSKNGMRVGMVNDRQHYPHNILALITGVALSLRGAGAAEVRLERAVEATSTVLEQMEKELDWSYYEK